MSTKSKSALSEIPNHKSSPATPRANKPSRGLTKSDADSPSTLQSSRLSAERSSRSVASKPTIERKSPKTATPPELKKTTRIVKPSELQVELNLVQDDLKKAKEKVVTLEKEKTQALDELNSVKKAAEEATAKLGEALVAKKQAEENFEVEKFRSIEMEQAGIEASHKKEEEWQNELETVRNQHALDVAALLSTSQELQKVKQELAMTSDAKNQALSHAHDATRIAEVHAEKVELLSAEIVQLKSLLDCREQSETNENAKLVTDLKQELEVLSLELQKAKPYEVKLLEKEACLEQLNVELEAAKLAESYAHNLVNEWKKRIEELEIQTNEAKRLEKSASESLESVMKQLEASNDSLHDAESEIASLKEKVGLLEISIRRQKGDLEESERCLQTTKEEASHMAMEVASLTSEVEILKEEKTQSLNNEKLAAASVQTLLEEKNKLINELEKSRNEEEKSKKAMESLASALHEVSTEARESKEKLLSSQSEHENSESQIEDLKLVVKDTNEKYKGMIDDAKEEIDALTNSLGQTKLEYQKFKAEWEVKELHLTDSLTKAEEANTAMEKEVSKLLTSLKEVEEEANTTKEEETHLRKCLEKTEAEETYLREVLGEAKAESMKFKESLMDNENELQNILQENEELRSRESASLQKVQELSKLLEEAIARQQNEENKVLTDSDKDYDMLPKVVVFSEQNGGEGEEKPKLELPAKVLEQGMKHEVPENQKIIHNGVEIDNLGGKPKVEVDKDKEDDYSMETNSKMWESYRVEEKDFSPEREAEQESFEEDLDSKAESNEGMERSNGHPSTENLENGGTSPSKQQSHKKKPLLRKFGSLLKKKSASSQK